MKRPETAANFKRAMEERQQTHSPETRVSCAGAADAGPTHKLSVQASAHAIASNRQDRTTGQG